MQRPPWVTNEGEWSKDCRDIVARARDLLEGRLGVVQTARELTKLAHRVKACDDPDFTIFIGIDSESLHLPDSSTRNLWAPDALVKKDGETRRLEETHRERACEAARHLLEKYA